MHDRFGANQKTMRMCQIEFIEVKRQAKNFNENVLKAKSELFIKAVGTFKGYEVIYRGLSIDDM